MHCAEHYPSYYTLNSKPSTSFSTTSSTASSRSNGTTSSFGEVDTRSERSSSTYHSVCSSVSCSSSTFLRLWLSDNCRNALLSHLAPEDLAALRSVCHNFSNRAAPGSFENIRVTFKTGTFTKPARLAALDRIGHHVKRLTFNAPHTADTFLPPLIDPELGRVRDFVYRPHIPPPTTSPGRIKQPKYGDWETTSLLIKQYPPLFHAATNVSSFIHAFSSSPCLRHSTISCPGEVPRQQSHKSVVDYALISLRIASERAPLDCLESLALSSIQPASIVFLSPSVGYGATPGSLRRWSRISRLTIHMHGATENQQEPTSDQIRLSYSYLRCFSSLTHLRFRWLGDKGPSPLLFTPRTKSLRETVAQEQEFPTRESHPALRPSQQDNGTQETHSAPETHLPTHFPSSTHVVIENAVLHASQIRHSLRSQHRTLLELELESVTLVSGTWDEALAPSSKISGNDRWRQHAEEIGEVPIMLAAPSVAQQASRPPLVRRDAATLPREVLVRECAAVPAVAEYLYSEEVKGKSSPGNGMRKLLSSSKKGKPSKSEKRAGLSHREDIRKAFRGVMLPWR